MPSISTKSLDQRITALEEAVQRLVEVISGGSSSGGATDEVRATVSQQDLDSLGQKLDSFSAGLPATDKAILLALVGAGGAALAGSGTDTEGVAFGGDRIPIVMRGNVKDISLGDGIRSIGRFNAGGLGALIDPSGPISDSVGGSVGATCVSVGWSKDIKAPDNIGEWASDAQLGLAARPGEVLGGQLARGGAVAQGGFGG
jgi:hypothetical protein